MPELSMKQGRQWCELFQGKADFDIQHQEISLLTVVSDLQNLVEQLLRCFQNAQLAGASECLNNKKLADLAVSLGALGLELLLVTSECSREQRDHPTIESEVDSGDQQTDSN